MNPAPANERPRLLVIDDDRKLCRLIGDYLSPLGYAVSAVHTGPEGVEKATAEEWHAIILDLMLPGMDGFEVLKAIRHKSDVPVLMLTARGDEADRIVGLEIGADDYLPKTFSTRELLARLRAVTRRNRGAKKTDAPEPEVVVGNIRINTGAHTAVVGDQPLVLTPVEYDLLLALARSRGRVKSREALIGIHHHVPGGAHRADEARVLRVVAEFFSQRGNVDVNRAVEHVEVAVADFVEQLFARFHTATRAGNFVSVSTRCSPAAPASVSREWPRSSSPS